MQIFEFVFNTYFLGMEWADIWFEVHPGKVGLFDQYASREPDGLFIKKKKSEGVFYFLLCFVFWNVHIVNI